MCGRFTLRRPVPELARLFRLDRVDVEELPRRFNIAPTQPVAVVRALSSTAPPLGRELVYLRWGLVPAWAEDPREFPTLINARAESLDRKPAFRDSLRDRRCLIPADGFYEWRREEGKQPYHVRLESGEPFAFAGLWDRWQGRVDGSEREVESCTIVTTDANDLLRPIHERMPVILRREDWEMWLDPDVRHPGELEALLQPFPSDLLVASPVSPRVNRPDEDDEGVLEPAGPTVRRPEDLPSAGFEAPTANPGGRADREGSNDGEAPDAPDEVTAEQLDLL